MPSGPLGYEDGSSHLTTCRSHTGSDGQGLRHGGDFRPGLPYAGTAVRLDWIMTLRRVTTALAATTAACTLALAGPVPAFAATGTLTIDATTYQDPADGCLNVGGSAAPRHFIANDTDTPVVLYTDTDCQGRPVTLVMPDDGTFTAFESVRIGYPA